MIDVIVAKTHTSDYLLHKYWARKPHNVLRDLIVDLISKKDGVVVDPFCGSGVFLREASKLGHKAYGFDVNPVAAMLSNVTCNPPDHLKFQLAIEPLLEKFKALCEPLYKTKDNDSVRYYVHDTVIECPKCKTQQTKSESTSKGSKSICFKCNQPLSYALANLIDTKINSIVAESGVIKEPDELELAKRLEKKHITPNSCSYDLNFTHNNRILAYEGMKTKNLFTERNFFLLSSLADWIHGIEDEAIRESALLLLTASVAQCSRLIAYRNNLTTGGPAWSVPGFWVPAQHLESNPYKHLIARYKKFLKGLEALNKVETKPVRICNTDCINLTDTVNEKVDLFFLDPPYGDSVPYMEFSMIWNSFLNKPIDVEQDISVSDRNKKKFDSWKNYKLSLIDRITILKNSLAENGKFLITFNNHDYRAWEALIEALQNSNMVCISTMYQIPAVVSSKAQFSKDGSYVSDIYSLYKYDPKSSPAGDLQNVQSDLIKSGLARGGKITKSVLYRSAFVSILKNNISSKLLIDLDSLITGLYDITGNDCILLGIYNNAFKVRTLESIVNDELTKYLETSNNSWDDFYAQIAGKTRDIGIPEPSEIISCIDTKIDVINGKILLLNPEVKQKDQMNLF